MQRNSSVTTAANNDDDHWSRDERAEDQFNISRWQRRSYVVPIKVRNPITREMSSVKKKQSTGESTAWDSSFPWKQ